MTKGPKGEKRPADLNRRAFDIVRIASGEAEDATPSAAAQKGGKVGGRARAEKLSAEERKAIAQKAAKVRWGK
ncbi:RNA-binding protein [Reyranella sp.]|uniref:RNA-binding protein n=1 Tax=Reyranella sp. TaxID=1929291 RepID=UPI003BAB880C